MTEDQCRSRAGAQTFPRKILGKTTRLVRQFWSIMLVKVLLIFAAAAGFATAEVREYRLIEDGEND